MLYLAQEGGEGRLLGKKQQSGQSTGRLLLCLQARAILGWEGRQGVGGGHWGRETHVPASIFMSWTP